jgi:hypothetical protein
MSRNYSKTTCCICGCNGAYLKYPNSRRWDGKSFSCNICYQRKYREDNADIIKKHNNRLSYMSNWKNGELDPYTSAGKGYIIEQIVCKTLGIKNLNVENNTFRHKYDGFDGSQYIQIKGSSFYAIERKWHRHIKDTEEFDILIFLCMDKYMPWKDVVRAYKIPDEYVCTIRGISIYENTLRCRSKWEDFKIDEKPFSDTYHNIEIDDCPALRKDKWREWLDIMKNKIKEK